MPTRAAAVALVVLVVVAGVAVAAGPSTGSWKASGTVSFPFTLKKGTCPLPPKNLKRPKARRGKVGRGVCYASSAEPPIAMVCPGGSSITGQVFQADLFEGLRIPSNGVFHLRSYAYTSDPDPVGFDEIDLVFRGRRASGFVRVTDTAYPNGQQVTCDSGKIAITAKK